MAPRRCFCSRAWPTPCCTGGIIYTCCPQSPAEGGGGSRWSDSAVGPPRHTSTTQLCLATPTKSSQRFERAEPAPSVLVRMISNRDMTSPLHAVLGPIDVVSFKNGGRHHLSASRRLLLPSRREPESSTPVPGQGFNRIQSDKVCLVMPRNVHPRYCSSATNPRPASSTALLRFDLHWRCCFREGQSHRPFCRTPGHDNRPRESLLVVAIDETIARWEPGCLAMLTAGYGRSGNLNPSAPGEKTRALNPTAWEHARRHFECAKASARLQNEPKTDC